MMFFFQENYLNGDRTTLSCSIKGC